MLAGISVMLFVHGEVYRWVLCHFLNSFQPVWISFFLSLPISLALLPFLLLPFVDVEEERELSEQDDTSSKLCYCRKKEEDKMCVPVCVCVREREERERERERREREREREN